MVNNSIPIALIIGIGATFLTFITLITWFMWRRFIRNTIKINFISKGGKKESIRKKKSDIINTITYKDGSYIFDEKALITTNWQHEIYYFKGMPTALIFNANKTTVTNINAENLKAIIETDLIAKLFKKDIVTFDNILLILVIIMSGISLFMLFKLSQGVKIANTPENIGVLRDVIKQALATGV